jgi:hypothetical protein
MIDAKQLIEEKCHQKLTGYSFHLCEPSGIEDARTFLKNNWKENHPFVIHKELLDWQYYDTESKRYNIILATHKGSGEIRGIYAFIPVSQFDKDLTSRKEMWLSIWKVRSDVKVPLLGLSMLSFLINEIQPKTLIGIKSTDIAKALYGGNSDFKTGMLNHFYILNPQKSQFELVGNFDGVHHHKEGSDGHKTIELIDEADLDALDIAALFASKRVPSKSVAYVKNRFVRHPVYTYNLFAIREGGLVCGLIVGRIQEHNGARALRIVDYFGDEGGLGGALGGFTRLLAQYDCEYIDFYNHGFSDHALARAGFVKRVADSPIVIPNHFDPFGKKNVDIDYLFRSEADVVICKADADQDRPNSIVNKFSSV